MDSLRLFSNGRLRFREEDTLGLVAAFSLLDEDLIDYDTPPDVTQQDFEAQPPSSLEMRAQVANTVIQRWLVKAADCEFEAKPDREVIAEAFNKAEMFANSEGNFNKRHSFRVGEASMMIAQVEVAFRRLQWTRAKPEFFGDLAEKVQQAKAIAVECGSKKVEGLAMVALGQIYRKLELNSTGWWKVGLGCGKTVVALEKAIDILDQSDDVVLGAKARHLLGDALVLTGDFMDGMCNHRDAHERFRECDRTRYEALEILFMACHFLHRNKCKEAVLYAEDALEILVELDLPLGNRHLAIAVQVLAKAQIQSLDVSSAQRLAAEWIDRFREKDDMRGLVVALMVLSETYDGHAKMDEVVTVYEEAVAAAEELGDKRLLHGVLLRFSELHRQHCNFEEAEKLSRQAVDFARELGDKQREASALDSLNTVLADRVHHHEDHEAADEHIRNVEDQKAIYDEVGDTSQVGYTLLSGVPIYLMYGELDEAMCQTDEAKVLFVRNKDKVGELVALSVLAELNISTVGESFEAPEGELLAGRANLEGEERDRSLASAISAVASMRFCAKAVKDPVLEAKVEALGSMIHARGKKKQEALHRSVDAFKMIRTCGAPWDVFEIMMQVCDIHMWFMTGLSQMPHKIMDQVSKEAHELALKMRKKKHIAAALIRRIHSVCAVRECEEAMKYTMEATELCTEPCDEPLRARMMSYVGYIHAVSGRKTEAIDAATAAYQLANKCPTYPDSIAAVDMCSKVFSDCGRNISSLAVALGMEAHGQESSEPYHLARNHPIPKSTDDAEQARAKPSRTMDSEVTEDTILDMARVTVGTQDLTLDSPLEEAGMDSLTAVSFRNGLQQNLGIKVTAELIQDFPTVREVAKHVRSKLGVE